jgi:hypothetical protein
MVEPGSFGGSCAERAENARLWHPVSPPEEDSMQQHLTPQELAEHFTLLPAEQTLLTHRRGINKALQEGTCDIT